MFMRIEDQNGTVLLSSEYPDDRIMDPEACLFDYLGDFELDRVVQVSWREENTGCYEYRVIFFEDEENPDHIVESGAFIISDS